MILTIRIIKLLLMLFLVGFIVGGFIRFVLRMGRRLDDETDKIKVILWEYS